MSATDTLRGYVDASTRSVTADNPIEYAYRDLGDSDLPRVLLQHFRGRGGASAEGRRSGSIGSFELLGVEIDRRRDGCHSAVRVCQG